MRGKVNVLSLGNEQDNNISAKKTKDEVAKELGANLAAQP